MRVSIGVLPTKRTKNSCSITDDETVRREGSRSRSFPKRLGWFGYWLLTYSSRAHWDFSCKLSMWAASDRPQASEEHNKDKCGQGQNVSETLTYNMLWKSLPVAFYLVGKLQQVVQQVKTYFQIKYYYHIILLLKQIRLSVHQAKNEILLNIEPFHLIQFLTLKLGRELRRYCLSKIWTQRIGNLFASV